MDFVYKPQSENELKQELIDLPADQDTPLLLCSAEELQYYVQLISNITTDLNTLLQSLRFLSNRDNDDYFNLFNLHALEPIIGLIETYSTPGDGHFMNPEIVYLCFTILNNIIALPIEKLTIGIFSHLQISLSKSMNCYVQCHIDGEITSLILDCLLILMQKPQVDISFFTNDFVLQFLSFLMNPHSSFEIELRIPNKAFELCNKMFHRHHKTLKEVFIDNDFIPLITKNLELKTPAVIEAAQLLGHIGYMNLDIMKHLPDDFFVSIIPELLSDEDSEIVCETIKLGIELAENNLRLSEMFIDICLGDFLELSEKSFQIKEVAIHFISLLINPLECQYVKSELYSYSIKVENAFLKHGTLDFFVDYLQTRDTQIIKTVCEALFELSNRFLCVHVNGVVNDNGLTPFTFLLQQSESLFMELNKLNDDDQFDYLSEYLQTALNLFNTDQ